MYVCTVLSAEINTKARNLAFVLKIEFGKETCIKISSTQIAENIT